MSDRATSLAPGLAALAAALAAALPAPASPADAPRPRVAVERLLDTDPLGEPFAFDVAAGGRLVLVAGEEVVDAAGRPFLAAPLARPGALDLGGGAPRMLADGGLHAVEGGAPRLLAEVPLAAALLAADGPRTFVAGVSGDGQALLFVHEEGKGHKALLALDEPVDAMAAAGGALFFACGRAVWVLREGGPARRLARLPGLVRVASLAADAARGLLFFSDGDALYALRGDAFAVVHRGVGGLLRWRGDDLYVLSWRERAVFRLRGLGPALLSPAGLAEWKDPCLDPVVGLFCRAAAERALLRAADGGPGGPRGGAGSVGRLLEARRDSLASLEASLAREAVAGAVGVVWTAEANPRPLGPGAALTTGGRGAAVTLWDGSELRLGPASRLLAAGCRPGGSCRLALANGLVHVLRGRSPAEPPAPRGAGGLVVAAGGLELRLDAGEVALFASPAATAILVLGGRAAVVAPGRGEVAMSAGEHLEVGPDGPLGAPAAVDPERVRRWWESVP